MLIASLPAALMTDEAPERYTVEAVFTRRPEQDEIAEILGSGTREYLTRAGYPAVEVAVSDRRLEIANTNLEELRDGLADVLADRLVEISEDVHARQDAATVRFLAAAATEQSRATAVEALAGSVTFRATGQREYSAVVVDPPAATARHARRPDDTDPAGPASPAADRADQ